ncbi:ATP-binding protein [Streptomyces sp. CA-179760]|uniref:ATP-binding protein n=1 Tax=Streptomyces sp. CA-179760 TaxID=3240054 RepID=UPI003D91BD2A
MKQNSPELTTRILHFSIQLSPTPRGARLARLLAAEQLRSWGLPLDPARQVIAELSANAVTHGRDPGRDFRLLLYVVADTLRVEVTDTRDDRLPVLSDSGSGLLPGLPPRKTVWAEIDLAPEPKNMDFGGAGGLPEGPHR